MARSAASTSRPRSAKGRARRTHELLAEEYPDAVCELDHENPFQLLIATILSAQATDVGVNKVTPGLFARFPDAESLAEADPEEVEQLIGSLGLLPQQGQEHRACAEQLVERHGGEVPGPMRDLVALAGVGRKTANVVRSVALGLPGPARRHPRASAERTARPHRPRPTRSRSKTVLNPMIPAAERGSIQSAHDPPRASGLCRSPSSVRRLCPGLVLSLGALNAEHRALQGGDRSPEAACRFIDGQHQAIRCHAAKARMSRHQGRWGLRQKS